MTTQNPSDADVIRAFVRAGIAQIHVSMPATIVTYDPVLQKATVQVAVRPRVDDVLTGLERPALEPTAPIPNIPVVWPSSSVAASTFGLFPGDPVTLVIQERDTDGWRTTGLPDNLPLDARRFDFTDAVAFPGGRSFNPAAPLTGPLQVGTQVDALGAHVIHSSIPVAGVKLGSAAAIESVMKGDTFEANLGVFMTQMAIYMLGVSTATTAVQIAGFALTFLPFVDAFKAQVLSGIHRSIKVKVDL